MRKSDPIIDLRTDHWTIVQDILKAHVPDREVLAFGSRATWTAKEYSDLDLALVGDESLPCELIATLSDEFGESDLPFKVDLVDVAQIDEQFRHSILRDGVRLQRSIENRSQKCVLVRLPYRSVVSYAIGGGWGTDSSTIDSMPVRVIRGTDFKNAEIGDLSSIPLRHERISKVVKRALSPGDVVLEISGGSRTSNQYTGRSLFISERILEQLDATAIPASFCKLVRFDTETIDPFYGFWCLKNMYQSGRVAIYEQQSTGISNFQFKHFLDSETLLIPKLSEQQEIACILGTLDDKIELNQRMNKTLEAMAQAIFKDWFVDFGPVQAKMEGKEPYLPIELWNLFPSKLTRSNKTNVPVTWQPKLLGECFELTMGQSPPGNSYNDIGDGLPFFQGKTDFGFRFPTNRRFCNAPSRFAQSGDTLVSVRAPVGATNMSWEKCCIGRGVATLRHVSKSSSYTYYSIEALGGRISEFEDNGTVFGAINRQQFESLEIIEPNPSVVEAFDSLIDPVDRTIRNNEAQTRQLTLIRDMSIPELMSGSIRPRIAIS